LTGYSAATAKLCLKEKEILGHGDDAITKKRNFMKNIYKLVISIAIPLAIGALGSYITVTGISSWYQTINKPSWNPPNAIFGPVWTTLFILMGIALYLVWTSGNKASKTTAITLFSIQLILNFFWSLLFFNQHQIFGALIEMVLFWISILLTIFAFSKFSKAAAWLLVPYISWVSFAMVLNFTIWQLNT